MNTELTACERFEYDKKDLRPGQDFEAPEIHARILVNGGRAMYRTRDMKAVEAPATPTTPTIGEPAVPMDEKPRRSGRRYARRDMQAEET